MDEKPPQDDKRELAVPTRDAPPTQAEAANVVRTQLNRIYNEAPPNQPKKEDPAPDNPYARTHQQQFDWSKYHSAWQHYYREYYHRYYTAQMHAERQKLSKELADPTKVAEEGNMVTGEDQEALRQRQFGRLKIDLLGKVTERAKHFRKSNHFVPLMSALFVGLLFLFLQFNSVVVAQVKSYVSPGAFTNEAVVVDPQLNAQVGPEPKLIIPKINVEVPIDFEVATLQENEIQVSLRDGATHYKLPGANAVPGQFGNTVILGHSGNDIFNQGAYKFVFVLLDRLQAGDIFYINYNSTRYIYRVSELKIIEPTQVSTLQIGSDRAMATLITCTPPGTALKRLVVFAEQISPDPAGDLPAPAQPTEQNAEAPLPGTPPTLLEQIWDFFF